MFGSAALWPGAPLLMKGTSQALEGKGGPPGRTALQRNTQGDIASTVPRDRQLLLCPWASFSLPCKTHWGEFLHSFLILNEHLLCAVWGPGYIHEQEEEKSALTEFTVQWEEAYSKQIDECHRKKLKHGKVENAQGGD